MFDAFTPLAGGQIDQREFTRQPIMDLGGSLNFTRLPNHQAMHPYPQTIGFVQGLLPLADATEYSLWYGQTPFGPYMGPAKSLPNMTAVFPNIQGGLSKVTG